MKIKAALVSTLLLPVASQADLPSYQSAVSGQSPQYYFNFDDSLSSVGDTATFTANGNAGFGPDYFGNANLAASFPGTADYFSLASPTVISGEGSMTAVGSMSMLFYVPTAIPATGYYFSDSETTGGAANGQTADSAFALQFSSSALTLKIGNKSYSAPEAVTAGTWYYLGLTYNLNGTATGVNGVNYYLGAIGGNLLSAFEQRGGSGNLSTTSTLGDGLSLVLGNKQAAVTGSPASTAGVAGGEIDEFATWNTELTADQITSQFNALTASSVPEPSPALLLALGAPVLFLRRKISSFFSH